MHLRKLLFRVLFCLLTSLSFPQPASKIYYTQYHETQTNVYQNNLEGTSELTIPMPMRPKAIGIDWVSNPQKMYVGLIPSTGLGKIIRCNIDGTNQEDVITELIGINEIELDLINRKIFWVQNTYDDDRIFKADMDGFNSGIAQIYSATAAGRDLWGMAIDVGSQRIWFTERGGTCYSSYIKRISTSGSNLTTIVNPVCNPHDIEYFNGKIYWGDLDGLEQANSDGSVITNIVSGAKVEGLAIDGTNHRVYWVDYIYNYVKRVDIDGSNETLISSGHSTISKIDTDYNPSAITSVEENSSILTTFYLGQNYPNPFNPSTTISWQSSAGGWHTLKVYDLLGNEVSTLIDEYKPAGIYCVQCTMNILASGIYFYQLKVFDPESGSGQSFIQTKKMIYLK
jgi:hypothetical protein